MASQYPSKYQIIPKFISFCLSEGFFETVDAFLVKVAPEFEGGDTDLHKLECEFGR
jgi:hypothetical protein